MNIEGERIRAILRVYEDFREIMKRKRCRTCACFYADMLTSVLEAARKYGDSAGNGEMTDVVADIEAWLDAVPHLDLHG